VIRSASASRPRGSRPRRRRCNPRPRVRVEVDAHEGEWSGASRGVRPTRCVIEPSSGEEFSQRRFELLEDLGILSNRGSTGGTKVVRRAATTKGDAVVTGALTIDDHVTVVGERLVVRESRRRPRSPGLERFGRDHQRVERHDGASLVRQVRRESLGRSHDERACTLAPDRDDLRAASSSPRDDSSDLGVLEDLAPSCAVTSLRPRTSRAGSMRAQCGENIAPSARHASRTASSSASSSQRRSTSPMPNSRASRSRRGVA
jgi:hypothetical protein